MWKALILPIGLVMAACSPPGSEPAAKSDMAMTTSESGAAIAGSGTVVAVDAAAGTVTLNHQPIAALSWPAMTMQFTAENPALLQGVAAGDQVDFELKSAAETQIITAIHKQ